MARCVTPDLRYYWDGEGESSTRIVNGIKMKRKCASQARISARQTLFAHRVFCTSDPGYGTIRVPLLGPFVGVARGHSRE